MNLNNTCDYIDATNSYPIIDYIDEQIENNNIYITSNTYSCNVKLNNNQTLNNSLYYIGGCNLNNPTNHLILSNNYNFGEIKFSTYFKYPQNSNFIGTIIDYTGKLKVYHNYNILQPTFGAGYYDVESELLQIKADGLSTDIQLTGIEAGLVVINNDIVAINGELISINGALIFMQDEIEIIAADLANRAEVLRFAPTINDVLASFGNFLTRDRNVLGNTITQGIQYGIGAAVIGSVGAIAGYVYNERMSNLAYNLQTSNFTITSNDRSNLVNLANNQTVYFASNYNLNNYNLNISNGFINSNTITQQFIPNLRTNQITLGQTNISNIFVASNVLSNINLNHGFLNTNTFGEQYINNLKCNTLNLNNGNISNINGISTNEIIASGKIKQNGILLDNIYLTSNHIYNLAFNYTAERQYPSKAYTTATIEDVVSLLGKSVYHQTLYLDNSIISYGSGFYEVYSSSTFDTPTTKDKLFNFNTTETTTSPRWGISLYNSGTGNYQANNSIDGSYYGDWVIIKMPLSIMLTRYKIYQRTDFQTKAPAEWKVYGSSDGITFTEIPEAHQLTRLTSYTFGFYEKTLASTFTTQYQYFGFVFNKLLSVSGQIDLSFAELQIFGKEIISNSIVSNIYASSNAVKSIVLNDMPNISKQFGFYISITTPIVIGTTTYYKYDIDLRQYTNLGVIQIGPQSGDTFRSFKIRIMLGTMFFSYIINDLPNVCYYDVFMSYKNTAAPPGVAGLNACAIGYPHNPTLQTIMPNNLFVMKNGAGDINYITCVSTNPLDCRVIISDLLG
jgi:hypothetical protein